MTVFKDLMVHSPVWFFVLFLQPVADVIFLERLQRELKEDLHSFFIYFIKYIWAILNRNDTIVYVTCRNYAHWTDLS